MEDILVGKPKANTKEKQKNSLKKQNSGSDSGRSSENPRKNHSSNSEKENPDLPIVEVSQKAIKKQPTLKTDAKQFEKNISEVKNREKPEVKPKEDQKIPEQTDEVKPKNKASKPLKKPEPTSEPEASEHPDIPMKVKNESPDNRSIKPAETSKFKDSKTMKSNLNQEDEPKNDKSKPRAETVKKIEEKTDPKNLLKNIDDPSDSSEKNSRKSGNSEKSSTKLKPNQKISKITQKKGKNSEKPEKSEKPDNSEEADDEIEGPIMKNPSNNVTEGEILQQLGALSKKNTSKLEEQDSYQLKDLGLRSSPNNKIGKFIEDVEETPSFPAKSRKPIKKQEKSSASNDEEAIKVNESQASLLKRQKNQKQTFGDQFPSIPAERPPRRKGSSGSGNSKSSEKSNKNQSSSSNKEKPDNVLGQIFVNKANELAGRRKSRSSSPQTPNLASPVKLSKQNKAENKIKPSKEKPLHKPESSDSAVWASPQEEILKLKQRIKDYEQIIEKQSNEILELKKSQNLLTGPKRKLSPKSSGFLHKRAEGTFLQKNPEMLKRDDFDFWKINEDAPNAKEPQKLEDIAALKDLWILNMESGSQLNSNLSGKKNSGVKANALTKFESNKSANIRNRFLPKISTKKDLSK